MTTEEYHIPVLLRESVAGLAIKPGGIYVDLTFGGGGHSREILKELVGGILIAFDQDPEAEENVLTDSRFRFIRHNYRYFTNHLKYMGIHQVDGVLADLGVSSHQLNQPERGFSFRFDARLDMRMNPGLMQSAADLISTLDSNSLSAILREYGEISQAGPLARRIAEQHQQKPIETTGDLVEAVSGILPQNKRNKLLAQIFQAFRIAVNQEIESLREMLEQSSKIIKQGGRLVVISYHSLEDRLVKNYVRAGNFEGKTNSDLYGQVRTPFQAINRQVVMPDADEIDMNSRARSARLRIAERTQW